MRIDNVESLYEAIKNKQYRYLKEELSKENEVDIALFIEKLKPHEAITVFRTLPKGIAAEVFAFFNIEMQQFIVNSITEREISDIIEDLFVDDAVDFLEELPANVVKKILQNVDKDTRTIINQFLQYPENTAGSIMTAEFVDLKKSMTVGDAILRIRRTGIDKETVYTCYITDKERHLEGLVSVKRLLLSDDDETISDIMKTNIISVTTTDDREDVAKLFSKYGLISIPVVDHEKRLVGIVTFDDAVEVIEQEATEDFEKMAAMKPSERPYLKSGAFTLAKNRLPWLLILMISAMITGIILQKYEHAFTAIPLLVTFIPMLTDTGGNAGSQSSTLIIRGMALSEINANDFFRVIWKEFRVSIIAGVALSFVNFIRLIVTYPGQKMMAFTVSLSLLMTVIIAKTIGGALPMVAKLTKADPAIMAAPLITTIVDTLSLILYFTIAKVLLNI